MFDKWVLKYDVMSKSICSKHHISRSKFQWPNNYRLMGVWIQQCLCYETQHSVYILYQSFKSSTIYWQSHACIFISVPRGILWHWLGTFLTRSTPRAQTSAAHNLRNMKHSSQAWNNLPQNVPECSISNLSWKFHHNPLMRFTMMLLTDTNCWHTYRQTRRQTDGQTDRQTDHHWHHNRTRSLIQTDERIVNLIDRSYSEPGYIWLIKVISHDIILLAISSHAKILH